MEKERKGYEILDEKISPENVMRMGELLALSALKFMCGHKMLHRMYANLARDIDYKDLDGYVFTDSYDLAQEAALFLCGYMGKSVFDTCIDPKSGKTYAIRRMCSKILCHKLYEEWKIKRYTDSTEDLYRSKEPFTDFEQDKETDYTKYDEIMEKLNLNKGDGRHRLYRTGKNVCIKSFLYMAQKKKRTNEISFDSGNAVTCN